MDQTEEPHKTHEQHPEEVEHHENSASKMFRKVKAKAKKFKNSLTKSDQSYEHDLDAEEDDELEPEVITPPGGAIGKPESLSHPRETSVPAPEESIPPGTKVFPVVSSDYSKPIEPVSLQDTSVKEESRDVPTHHPLSELSDREEIKEAHHESLNTPVSLLSGKEDVTRTFSAGGEEDHLGGQRKVNIESPVKLEDDSATSGDYLSGVSNYQSKGTEPTPKGSGESRVPELTESLGLMKVTDESSDKNAGQEFERDLSTRSKEFRNFDQDFDSVLGKDTPLKFAGESGADQEKDFPIRSQTEYGMEKKSPTGFGSESGAELEKDWSTRSHDFDMKTESGMDRNSPSRSHEFDLKTESGSDKKSPIDFESESGAELGKDHPTGSSEVYQKIDSGRNEYSPEIDGGLGAPLGGNFPVSSHDLDLKNESGIHKDSPTGFDGEPDFLAKGRPGYGEQTEETNFSARSDDVKAETELGRDLPTGTLDQLSPELSRPKERDEFVESRNDFEEARDETTQEPKPSSYTEKFASMLGYSGDQTQVAGTVDEKLTPVNEKGQETESVVSEKLPLSGGGSGGENREQEDEKGVLGKDYLAEKLTPGEEDKALSEVIKEKLQIGGGEEKEATTTKEVTVEKKIPTEKETEESEHGQSNEEEVKGVGMVGMIKGWFGGAATEEEKPKSPHSVESSQSLDPTVGTKGFPTT